MFSDIRRFQQDTTDPAGAPPLPCAMLVSLTSIQPEDTGSSLKDSSSVPQSERDLFLASLGYDRYTDPYFLPTS
jgi:hypothetical protein